MASAAKIQGQEAKSSTVWPRVGASTGTPMNTMEDRDITRAMSRPV